MVIKERCDVLRGSTEERCIQFCRRRRKGRKIFTKRQGRFFRSPLRNALGRDFALFVMAVDVDFHHRNRSFATNNGRMMVSEGVLFSFVAVVGMKIASVVVERERKR